MLIALTLLSIGLLAAAGLVRAVSHLSHRALVEGDQAIVAQQALESAVAQCFGGPPAVSDTVAFGSRLYAVEFGFDVARPDLERVSVNVVAAGVPGFGSSEPLVRSFTTYRRRTLPLPLPPKVTAP